MKKAPTTTVPAVSEKYPERSRPPPPAIMVDVSLDDFLALAKKIRGGAILAYTPYDRAGPLEQGFRGSSSLAVVYIAIIALRVLEEPFFL